MVVNSFALATLYTINKQLLQGLPSSQATLLYKLFVFLFLAPWVLRKGFKNIKTPVMKLHILRAFLSISGSLCFAYGLKHVGLVNATALGYTEQILWAVIGIVYFREKMTKLKCGAVFVSFIAMLLIMFPTSPIVMIDILMGNTSNGVSLNFDYHYIFVIAAALFWACNSTVIKILGKTVRNEVQAFYVLLFSVIIAYPAAFIEWEWHSIANTFLSYPTLDRVIGFSEIHLNKTQLIQLLMLAMLYFVHVFSFFLSMKYAEMSTVAPFDYTRLIFTCILSYLFLGNIPQHTTQYIGCAMIILCGIVLVTSEKRKQKKQDKIQLLETQIENA